jgi:hypothetical protein
LSHCCNCPVRVTNRAFHVYGVLVCVLVAALLVVCLVSLHSGRGQRTAISASLQRIEINQGVLIHEVNSLAVTRPAAIVAPAPKPKAAKPKTPPKPCRKQVVILDGSMVCCCK